MLYSQILLLFVRKNHGSFVSSQLFERASTVGLTPSNTIITDWPDGASDAVQHVQRGEPLRNGYGAAIPGLNPGAANAKWQTRWNKVAKFNSRVHAPWYTPEFEEPYAWP